MVKFVVIGDHQAGKTSVIRRFCEDVYTTHYKPTLGVDFHRKTIHVSGVDYHIELWDMVGKDKIGGIAKVYYRKALGVLLVCDAERPMFSNLMKWKEDMDDHYSLPNGNPIPVVLLVNKIDNAPHYDRSKFDRFVTKYDFVGWFECSAKKGVAGIDQAVYTLLNAVLSQDMVLVHENVHEGEDDITFDTDEGTSFIAGVPSSCAVG